MLSYLKSGMLCRSSCQTFTSQMKTIFFLWYCKHVKNLFFYNCIQSNVKTVVIGSDGRAVMFLKWTCSLLPVYNLTIFLGLFESALVTLRTLNLSNSRFSNKQNLESQLFASLIHWQNVINAFFYVCHRVNFCCLCFAEWWTLTQSSHLFIYTSFIVLIHTLHAQARSTVQYWQRYSKHSTWIASSASMFRG